ncbi:hypothetical protein D9M71_650060 [compost metagenome]
MARPLSAQTTMTSCRPLAFARPKCSVLTWRNWACVSTVAWPATCDASRTPPAMPWPNCRQPASISRCWKSTVPSMSSMPTRSSAPCCRHCYPKNPKHWISCAMPRTTARNSSVCSPCSSAAGSVATTTPPNWKAGWASSAACRLACNAFWNKPSPNITLPSSPPAVPSPPCST